MIKVGIGQDSHSFDANKSLVLAGLKIPDHPGFLANSDGDVILHAITNSISSITGKNILGKIADDLCKQGITDSKEYLNIANTDLNNLGYAINHIAISIECLTPKINQHIKNMQANIASILSISQNNIGITATSGEGLSDYGKGLGVFATAIITAQKL